MNMFIILLILSIYPHRALAEWATDSQADYEMVRDDIVMNVAGDGSYTVDEEVTYRAVNERGRSKLVLESIPYVPSITEVKITDAVSITDGVETQVNLKSLQRRKAKGPEGGLDSNMEIVIPFANIKVGSMVRYKVLYHHKKASFNGVFTTRFFAGLKFPELGGKAVIKSAKPLRWAIADTDKIFKVTEAKEGPLFVLTFLQHKPAFKIPLDFLPSLKRNSISAIDVSTGESWEKFATEIRSKYEKILEVKELPLAFKAIAEKASKTSDVYEKANIVTSELATVMTYSGDWTSPEKFFFPQPLASIALKKTGDCKDFATATTVILRSLGLKADIALVRRVGGLGVLATNVSNPIDDKLVIPELFNHAIVHIQDFGKSIWVDPTNHVSNASFPFDDIAGSPALVLEADTKGLRYVPHAKAVDSRLILSKTIRINADDTADTNGTLVMTGEYAKHISEVVLTKNLKEGQEKLILFYGSGAKENQIFIEGADLKSRISAKLEVQIKTLSEKIVKDSDKEAKKYLVVPMSSRMGIYLKVGDKRVSDFYVGSPSVEESKIKVIGYDFGEDSLGCVARTPWYSIERKLTKTSDGFEVKDKIDYKVGLIPMDEANSDRFSYELDHIQACAYTQAIQIEKIEGRTISQRLEKYTLKELKRLNDSSGPESIGNAMRAKHIAEQLLINDPKNKDLRIQLYRALTRVGYIRNDIDRTEYNDEAGKVIDSLYAELSGDPTVLQMKTYFAIRKKNVEEMKKFFKLAYYASPKGVEIFKLGGYVAEKLDQPLVAEGSYLKALSFSKNPDEQGAIYDSLADVARSVENADKAVGYYEKAIEKLPKDAWLFSHYVGMLVNLHRWDQAIDKGERMLKISDFGVGRGLLADAYSGKALSKFSARLKQGGGMGDPEQDALSEICMKALKYKNTESGCLKMIGFFALNTAKVEGKLEHAQKAFDYFSRALKDDKLEDPAPVITLRNSAEALIQILKAQNGERIPAGK